MNREVGIERDALRGRGLDGCTYGELVAGDCSKAVPCGFVSRRAVVGTLAGLAACICAGGRLGPFARGLLADEPAAGPDPAAGLDPAADPAAAPTDDAVWNPAWVLRTSSGDVMYCADAPLDANGRLDYGSAPDVLPAQLEATWRLPARWAYDAVRLPQAWDVLRGLGMEPGAGVTVGIFDSPIYTDHEDMPAMAVHQEDVSDWLEVRHGTRVTGIIGACANNGTGRYGGTVGVAYASSLIGLSYGHPDVVAAAEGPDDEDDLGIARQYAYALDLLIRDGARVVNCSNGLPCATYLAPAHAAEGADRDRAREIIQKSNDLVAGVLNTLLDEGYDFVICKASGNYNSVDDPAFNTEGSAGIAGGQDASLDILSGIGDERLKSRIIVVGGVEEARGGVCRVAPYSAGGERVDVAAPGSHIYSPSPYVPGWQSQQPAGLLDQIVGSLTGDDARTYKATVGNGYWAGYGTSFAAPIASGAAALVWAAKPELTGAEVKAALCTTAGPQVGYGPQVWEQTTAFDPARFYPLLNVEAAVRSLATSFPVGEFCYMAIAGGGQTSVKIDETGHAVVTDFMGGTGKGSTMYYQMVVDESVEVSAGLTAYRCVATGQPGESWEMGENGVVPTGTFEVTWEYAFIYNADTGSLYDEGGSEWVRCG